MLVFVALLQISIGSPPSLDDARRALHTADTAAAVATLSATIRADTLYDAEDLAALILLHWIGRSPEYSTALSMWKSGVETVSGRKAVERWTSPLAFIAMRNFADLDQGKDDRFIQEGPIHYVHAKLVWVAGRLVEEGIKETDSAVLGPGDERPPGRAWRRASAEKPHILAEKIAACKVRCVT